jgi:hypothetical protein
MVLAQAPNSFNPSPSLSLPHRRCYTYVYLLWYPRVEYHLTLLEVCNKLDVGLAELQPPPRLVTI